MPRPLEELFRPHLRGYPVTNALSGTNQFAGRTTINSGSSTQVVSTTVVRSDSIILLAAEANTRQSSGVAAPIEVTSLDHQNSFTLTTAGTETLGRDTTVMWLIFNTSQ